MQEPATPRPRERSAILAELSALRRRLGGWTPTGLAPEHRALVPGRPPLPADYYTLKSRIQALKRELARLP